LDEKDVQAIEEVRTKLPLGKVPYEMADPRPTHSVNQLIEVVWSFELDGKKPSCPRADDQRRA
jgi:hypothetical protein